MKRICFIVIMMFHSFGIHAQLSAIEQLQLDIEKLAQMRSMLSSMYEGYSTLSNGYNQVSSIAKGNFDLHKHYLDGLAQVSPTVKRYQKINNIISGQAKLISEFSAAYAQWQRGGFFQVAEILQIKSFGDEMKEKIEKGLAELLLVTTAGNLKMSDDERIRAIDRMDKGLNEEAARWQDYLKSIEQVMRRRAQAKRDIDVMRKLNGVR